MDNSLQVTNTPSRAPLAPLLPTGQLGDAEQAALQLAAELFAVVPSLDVTVNPEFPDDVQSVITVCPHGEIDKLVQLTSIWHQRMVASLGERGSQITIRVVPNVS